LRVTEDYQQRFVLITNARSKVETLIGSRVSGEWVGVEKEAMLAQLILDLNGEERWKAIDASNYTAIPMWGETAPRTISESTTTISSSPVLMLRMIAKIEVQLDVDNYPTLEQDFKLKSVHVYNTNTSGRIVPISGTDYVKDMIAIKASLPASVSSVVGPIKYTDFSTPGIENVAMKGAIYLFETAAKMRRTHSKKPASWWAGGMARTTTKRFIVLTFLHRMVRHTPTSCATINIPSISRLSTVGDMPLWTKPIKPNRSTWKPISLCGTKGKSDIFTSTISICWV
jgi:hypothetical protein